MRELIVSGAVPKYLTLSAFLDEGIEISQFNRGGQ